MNQKMRSAVIKHGENLQAIFPKARDLDPVTLCRRLRQIEAKGADIALQGCNGPDFEEGEQERREEAVLASMDKLLGFREAGVPVFVNMDPRGYALKIDSKWVRDADDRVRLHTDFGGYGIIAPDLTEEG